MHIHKCKWCMKPKRKGKRGRKKTELKDTKQKRRLQRAAGAPGIQSQMGTRDRKEENSSEGGHRTNFYPRITFKKKGGGVGEDGEVS